MAKVMTEAEQAFEQAMEFYKNGYWGKALDKVREAVELDKQNPKYVSYLGLLVAVAKKTYDEAEQLCHVALRLDRKYVQGYLNLADVYIRARKKADAVECLTVGIKYTKRDVKLVRALRKLGVRRAPVIPFLERKHFLNRHLGQLRHRVLQMLGKE